MGTLSGEEKPGFTVSTSSFQESRAIPAKFAMKAVEGGQNISPGLSWGNLPEGTKTIAVTCIDIHPVAHKWVHWMVINIPADSTGIPEGASPGKMPKSSKELKNSYGDEGYGGPQPPKGSGVHSYIFTVYALSGQINTSGSVSEDAFLKLISGKVIAKSQLTGTFSR
ncbi:MAG: YbhB/YbcL family Raf kinase inhibitor-like protein [Victivallales bacterium]